MEAGDLKGAIDWRSQEGFDIRCEWGEEGVRRLAPVSRVIVIVDVLSFSTAVSVAVERGAIVYPYRHKDETAVAFAASVDARLAGSRRAGGLSLSPGSLGGLDAGTRVVLPSPNGATLTLLAGATPVLAGCLRNASAVARAAERFGTPISVIPAGERWPDGSLRPAVEDLLGAGAIIAGLSGTKSPEAQTFEAVFHSARSTGLDVAMMGCLSGRELTEGRWAPDVVFAAQFDATPAVPVLRDGAFRSSTA